MIRKALKGGYTILALTGEGAHLQAESPALGLSAAAQHPFGRKTCWRLSLLPQQRVLAASCVAMHAETPPSGQNFQQLAYEGYLYNDAEMLALRNWPNCS